MYGEVLEVASFLQIVPPELNISLAVLINSLHICADMRRSSCEVAVYDCSDDWNTSTGTSKISLG